ncbi:MAG: hypothetical protein LBB11_04345 [Puniceicoccales bacterium]|nr:hypothetical protein [Puniceicoccales bacterium]
MTSLIIDASTVLFQAGILKERAFIIFDATSENTLSGFFKLVTPLFRDFAFDEVIFSEGPGRLRGIRSTLMLVRVLKVIHPSIKIYSYNNLMLAYKILENMRHASLKGFDEYNNDTSNATQRHECFEHYNRRIKSPKQITIDDESALVSDPILLCARKNRTQYYLLRQAQITLVDYEALKAQGNKIYALKIYEEEAEDDIFIPIGYNLQSCEHWLTDLVVPNEAVETSFDPQNEYQKWTPFSSKTISTP